MQWKKILFWIVPSRLGQYRRNETHHPNKFLDLILVGCDWTIRATIHTMAWAVLYLMGATTILASVLWIFSWAFGEVPNLEMMGWVAWIPLLLCTLVLLNISYVLTQRYTYAFYFYISPWKRFVS